ncbi:MULTISPECIES: DUF1573 domain-containing protein [unclassified Carboxylicivirga]|uniref:DUF1573 domain-containing protein n=1 Tax=Carboxylicivirga TaxID=1628153 RepID=UPI003D32E2F7
MKQLVLFSLLAISGFFVAKAQHAKPNLAFDKVIHNFGEVKEDGGTTSYEFTFKNTGGQPLVLHNVKASCGCTTPQWTRTPIPPGGTGFVKAIFDPRNRPGNFNKTITVMSNAQNATVILRINGKVLPREQTMEDIYPRNMDAIRLETSHLAFTKMAPNQVKEEHIKIISTSEQPVKLGFVNVPKHITIKSVPEVLQPGKAGMITATYDAKAKNDWGFVTDNIFIIFNDERSYSNRLTVSASIQEDFSTWDAQKLANAPVAAIAEKNWNFGEIKQGDVVKHEFEVKNTGKSELIIRKVKASCGCTAIKPAKTILAPGETTLIAAEFNSRGKSGRQTKTVRIVSNDPKHTTITLMITGNVTIN